jgi:hypothetical protein
MNFSHSGVQLNFSPIEEDKHFDCASQNDQHFVGWTLSGWDGGDRSKGARDVVS